MKYNQIKSLCCLIVLLMSPFVLATTIQKLSFEELVELSELIIEGEVLTVEPFVSDELVYTQVVIKVSEVLKGVEPGEFVELQYLGGIQNGISVNIAGQDIPSAGERGFYFIENPLMKAVNPLTGWSQGHFRIITDVKGNEHLESEFSQIDENIVELNDNKNSALAGKLRNMKFSNTLVQQAYYTPSTPDDLREAVYGYLDARSGD